MTQSNRFRFGSLAVCVLLMAVVGSPSAEGAPILLSLTPDTNALSVPQNTKGATSFITATLSNASTFNVGFSGITALAPIYVSGDGRDTVTNPTIGNMPKGALRACSTTIAVQPGGSCVIQLVFDTIDGRDPDPDTIAGVYSETVNVVAFEAFNPGNSQGFQSTVQITVTDAVPEPSSLPILGAALMALALCGRLPRRPRVSPSQTSETAAHYV